ncbi:hypothetical protein N1851_026998 [Merluccius polli]|uniref:Uncharacterized protein n=1 Tax=Merluccius polli TaxID=89951 RepID=A0AA47MB32_MERPO|nr:hypothetical protein N1851_026998 [Merluccius polli]
MDGAEDDLSAGGGAEDACGRFKRFENTLTEFLDLQAQVQQLLSASDRETDRTNWFEPKRLAFEEFMDYAKGWIQSQPAHEAESLPLECLRMNPSPALPHPPDNIQPEDSISTTSSQRSASARKRTEAECTGLLAKAKALEKNTNWIWKRLELKLNRKRLNWKQKWPLQQQSWKSSAQYRHHPE